MGRTTLSSVTRFCGLMFLATWCSVALAHGLGNVAYESRMQLDGGPLPPEYTPDSERPLGWWNVVLLVNANSPASLEVAKMYREFYPAIDDRQIVYLSGLADCAAPSSTPEDEIISREDFESYIAEPTRVHLVNNGLVDYTFVIITTAGMPYRIDDTDPALDGIVGPASSNAALVLEYKAVANAASVESELAVLFQIDPLLDSTAQAPLTGRLINPYQGYRCSIKKWADERDIIWESPQFSWAWLWRINQGPMMEGDFDFSGYSAKNRRMNPGSMYLVARLDGPHDIGASPVFAVREMLERSAAVSNPQSQYFVGYDADSAAFVIDYAPDAAGLQETYTYNLPSTYDTLDHCDNPTPPGAETFVPPWRGADHYVEAYDWLTGSPPAATSISVAAVELGLGGTAYYDSTSAIMNQSRIGANESLIGLLTFGRNSNDGRPKTYLLTSGPGGGPLFDCAYGAVFASLESFNAVTMFSNATTSQAKLVDFIEIGGSAAIGHSFEPELGAQIQGEYLQSNLVRDMDANGVADMAAVEAAFTALPYLSWSEVFIGDPLMRLRRGPGGTVDLELRPGDVDDDYFVGFLDYVAVAQALGSSIGEPAYWTPADLTQDGTIDEADLDIVLGHYNQEYPRPG